MQHLRYLLEIVGGGCRQSHSMSQMMAAWMLKPVLCGVYAFDGNSMLIASRACATVQAPSRADGLLQLDRAPQHLHGTSQNWFHYSNIVSLRLTFAVGMLGSSSL